MLAVAGLLRLYHEIDSKSNHDVLVDNYGLTP